MSRLDCCQVEPLPGPRRRATGGPASRAASALLWLLAGISAPAAAVCQLPATSAAFGSLSSFTVNLNASSASGNINVNCGSGSTVSLLGANSISLQLTGASNVSGSRAVLTNGGDAIPVQLCTSANCATELAINGSIANYTSAQLLNLVGLLGGLNFSIPLTLRTVPGQNVAAGTYTGTLSILTRYNICTGIGALGMCLPGSNQTGSAVEIMSVSLTVTNDCTTISAPAINFGSAPVIDGFSTVSQQIAVVCTKGSRYTVGLNNGSHAINNVRNMASGSNLLSYDIYKGSDGTRWEDNGSGRWDSAAATTLSSDALTRSFSYSAKILPNQPSPAAGSYTDSIVIDLSF